MTIYSYTSLDTFRVCPRKFKYAYVDKVSVPERVNADTYLGMAVHRALRELYTHGADGVLYPRDDIVHFYRNEWNKLDRNVIAVGSDYYAVDDYIRIGEQMLLKYYDTNQPFNQGTLLGAEMSLIFTLPGTSYRIRCYVDRLWKDERGTVEICDYKTGKHLAKPNDPAFFYQMGLYQLAVQENFPQFTQIEVAQYFLRKDEVVRHRMSPEEIEQLKEEIRVAILEIHRSQRFEDFPTREGPHCNYCDYADICPAKKHRRLLEEEETQDTAAPTPQMLQDLANQYVDVWERSQSAKAELDELKTKLLQYAREYDLSVFEGDKAKVNVRLSRNEKFITKTQDPEGFADLTTLSRRLGLEDYFVLDANTLLKEIFLKRRLPDDQLKQLEQFVVVKDDGRVTVRLNRDRDSEDDPIA